MTLELSDRFRYSNGEPKNGLFMSKELTETELDTCFILVADGPLGLGEKDINDLGLTAEVEELVNEGIIRKVTLLQMAEDLVKDESAIAQMERWEDQGGFLTLEREGDRNVFRAFDQAQEIVEQGEVPENLITRYQVIPDLYKYIDLVYDDL